MKKLLNSKKFYFFTGISVSFIFILFAGSVFYNKFNSAPAADSVDSIEAGSKLYPHNYRIISPVLPEDLNFAGEAVPLEDTEIKERMEREFIQNTYWHSFTLLALKRSTRYFPVIEPILKQYGIPDDFKYVAVIESGLTNAVSPAGATGMWQLMDEPAKKYGLEVNSEVDERYHIEKATAAACRYLLDAYSLYQNWTLAAASYNMGLNGVSRQLDRQFAANYYDLYLNEETSRYIARVIALKEIIKNPSLYGFSLSEEDYYQPLIYYTLDVYTLIDNLASFARSKGITYKVLKLYNPWLRDIRLAPRNGKTYTLKIPIK